MSRVADAYEQLIERLLAWAQDRPDIRAALVLGSRARTDRPADEWSDLDILLVVTDPEPYLTTTDWLKNMGDFRITFIEATPGGNLERRVLFDGGLDVDFPIIPHAMMEQMLRHGIPSEVAAIFGRGVRVLIDREDLAGRLHPADPESLPPRLPTQAEVVEVINDFWYHAVWTAKKLKRGELWTARACSDGYMKRLLLKMLEWHTQATSSTEYDTWHDGRFMEQWADPRVLEGLRDAFAHYDRDDIRRALLATMDLFRWLAQEVTERLDYRYPKSADDYSTGLVNTLLSEDSGAGRGDGF